MLNVSSSFSSPLLSSPYSRLKVGEDPKNPKVGNSGSRANEQTVREEEMKEAPKAVKKQATHKQIVEQLRQARTQ